MDTHYRRGRYLSRLVLLITVFTLCHMVYSQGLDQATLNSNHSLDEREVQSVFMVTWNPNGDVLAAATDDGIRIFDHLLQPITSVHLGDVIYGISWSPDGSQLAVTHNSQLEVWQWNPEAASLVLTDEVHGNGWQIGVLWSPDGQRIVSMEAVDLGGVWYGTYHFWTADPVQSTGLAQGLYYFFNPPNSSFMGWAPNGQPVLMGFGYYVRENAGGPVFDSPRQYYLIDASTGQRLREVITGQLSMSASWRPPAGDLLAIGSETGVDLFDIMSGQPISNLDAFYDPRSLDWSPDGRYLAGSSLVADYMTGEVVGRLGSNISHVTALDWHPSGLWLAVVEDNARLTIEDAMQWPDFVPPVLPSATSTAFHTDIPTPEPTATSTPTDTPTFTPTPTPPPTLTPIPTATPTPAAFQRLRLTSLCSAQPGEYRLWRVRNSNPVDVVFTWDLYRSPTGQNGFGVVPPAVGGVQGEVIFSTLAEAGPNSLRLFVNGAQQDVKASSGATCPTPTPAP